MRNIERRADMTPADPLEASIALGEALEANGIPYAVGGALAFGLWAIPRATVDIDINVFVEPGEIARVVQVASAVGVELEIERAQAESDARGMFVGRFGSYRVDFFTPSIEFAWEAKRTRVVKSIDGHSVSFLAAEALAVFKLLFFRAKDIVDLQRLLAVQGARLDIAYVRRHLVEMMGEGDSRVQRWDALCADAKLS